MFESPSEMNWQTYTLLVKVCCCFLSEGIIYPWDQGVELDTELEIYCLNSAV